MTSGAPDYYALLHVDPTASQQEIARAYRSLMRTHHPDVGKEPDQQELLGIMHAFSVLRDPGKRGEYDRLKQKDEKPKPAPPTAVPVRRVKQEEPLLRATPVRWESGPWAGNRPYGRRGERP
jgi:curved DNA-binding protein CbpA